MKQKEIDYSVLVELEFKVERDTNDKVFFNQHGYEWFIVSKKYMKGRICIDWDSTTRTCELRKIDKEGWVKSRMPILSEKMLRQVDEFLSA